MKGGIFVAIIHLLLMILCSGEKIESKIYESLKKYQACILLTNATHQVGCTSNINGNTGILHFINNDDDLKWLINKGSHKPYIPLLNSTMFTRNVMDQLMESDKISGALIIYDASIGLPSEGFSPDNTCPMDNFGIYGNNDQYSNCQKFKWNPMGNGMSYVYYGIPIFILIDQDEIEKLTECISKHNIPTKSDEVTYPLCAVEMKDFMFAAKDTPTCKRKTNTPNPIKSTYCDELEDKNVYGSLYPMVGTLQKDSIIMAATKIDATAFFHDIGTAADNGVTGIVTLLAAAYSLGQYKRDLILQNKTEKLKPIVFSFFNGEVWDYIGSSKMVFDMERNHFPYPENNKNADINVTAKINDDVVTSKFDTSHIRHFVEISQVGLADDVYVHTDPLSRMDEDVKRKMDDLINVIKNSTDPSVLKIKLADVTHQQPLPPASFQRFLRARNISGVVFTDHEKSFANKYYNSRFDNAMSIQLENEASNGSAYPSGPVIKKLDNLAIAVANTLYKLASDGREPQQNLTIPANLTGDLLNCFLYTSKCKGYKEIFESSVLKKFPNAPLSRYISVRLIENPFTTVIHNMLAYYTGEWLDEGECTNSRKKFKLPNVYNYMTVPGKYINNTSTCVRSATYTTPAVSPAFELEDYTSTEYSTWAESMWYGDIGVKMFLVGNPISEIVILVVGLLMLMLTFLFTYFIRKNTQALFTSNMMAVN